MQLNCQHSVSPSSEASLENANTSGSGLPSDTFGSGSSDFGPSGFQPITECLPSHVCGGSASLERGFVTGFAHPDEPSCNPQLSDSFTVITERKQHDIQMNEECDKEDSYL